MYTSIHIHAYTLQFSISKCKHQLTDFYLNKRILEYQESCIPSTFNVKKSHMRTHIHQYILTHYMCSHFNCPKRSKHNFFVNLVSVYGELFLSLSLSLSLSVSSSLSLSLTLSLSLFLSSLSMSISVLSLSIYPSLSLSLSGSLSLSPSLSLLSASFSLFFSKKSSYVLIEFFSTP